MRSTSKLILSALLTACVFFSGCFQAEMTTDKEPGDTVVEKSFASSFIFGLVPATVDVSDDCTNGIASAERKISFLNGLVGGLTLNLYTPQSVTVTCAAGGAMSDASQDAEADFTVSENAEPTEIEKTLSTAALQSALTQESVEVQVAPE